MAGVTRDVEIDDVSNLLRDVPRACIGMGSDEGPVVVPVAVRSDGRTHRFGVPVGQPAPEPGQEVVLLVDDGVQWFELRAVYLRGAAVTVDAAPPERAPDGDGFRWFGIDLTRAVAWDYGSLREVPDAT